MKLQIGPYEKLIDDPDVQRTQEDFPDTEEIRKDVPDNQKPRRLEKITSTRFTPISDIGNLLGIAC